MSHVLCLLMSCLLLLLMLDVISGEGLTSEDQGYPQQVQRPIIYRNHIRYQRIIVPRIVDTYEVQPEYVKQHTVAAPQVANAVQGQTLPVQQEVTTTVSAPITRVAIHKNHQTNALT